MSDDNDNNEIKKFREFVNHSDWLLESALVKGDNMQFKGVDGKKQPDGSYTVTYTFVRKGAEQ